MKKKKKKLSDDTFFILFFLFLMLIVFVVFVVLTLKNNSKETGLTCVTSHSSIRIERIFYQICFNKKTKQPNWVLQYYFGEHGEIMQKSNVNAYRFDPKIPENDQTSTNAYQNTHWVLGNYLFPFSEKGIEIYGANKEDQLFFSVTSPQDPKFHRRYWKNLREHVRSQVKKKEKAYICILSGPLFLREKGRSNLGFLDRTHVPIPTHFFQVTIPNCITRLKIES